ncbi:hypothetical protein AB0M43_10520 [Longispora sp. NPDC051575]|uniref:hypothetical protein n=1 Tax=Longispora sp. NPDC051575 TaxID=3154943 RepID=UPI0034431B42
MTFVYRLGAGILGALFVVYAVLCAPGAHVEADLPHPGSSAVSTPVTTSADITSSVGTPSTTVSGIVGSGTGSGSAASGVRSPGGVSVGGTTGAVVARGGPHDHVPVGHHHAPHSCGAAAVVAVTAVAHNLAPWLVAAPVAMAVADGPAVRRCGAAVRDHRIRHRPSPLALGCVSRT